MQEEFREIYTPHPQITKKKKIEEKIAIDLSPWKTIENKNGSNFTFPSQLLVLGSHSYKSVATNSWPFFYLNNIK